jgi:ABC-type nitrate/sulfonate/bicarbonate transport system permease component
MNFQRFSLLSHRGDQRYLELAKVIGLSRFDLVRHVILPQALHAVWTRLRSSLSNAGGLVDPRPS